MTKFNPWLLPEGIEEILPPDAAQLEALCRSILDHFSKWGYELVMPPFVEFLDSLLTGTGRDLDLQTFKITDQLTGRMMGIRADITPQVARIDINKLKREMPTRLCYVGTVLHTRPTDPGGTRAPLQIGAELYGHAGVESDAEIIALMLKTLQIAGIKNVNVDLGHVGIYRGLINGLNISEEQEATLFDTLQRKATAELKKEIEDWSIPETSASAFLSLINLHGREDILDKARLQLQHAGKEILVCIDELQQVTELVKRHVKDARFYFDLAELRGYHYHTGMMFSAYVTGQGQAIANGGRYDNIGRAFGQSRPATGFSTDIKILYEFIPRQTHEKPGIFAPVSEVPGLYEAVDALREKGEKVIYQLPGQIGGGKALDCDRELYLDGGRWKIRDIKE